MELQLQKPRQLFAAALQQELQSRDLHPTDVLRAKWDKPIKDAVRAAMQASPVLFDPVLVARWMGVRAGVLNSRLK